MIEKELSGEMQLRRSLLGGALARILTKEVIYTGVKGLT